MYKRQVNVVPQLKAGGSFATAAYATLEHPVAVAVSYTHLRPIAAKNSVTRVRDRAIRKNSPQGVPERNIAMAKREASRYAAPTIATPTNTVNAFAQ